MYVSKFFYSAPPLASLAPAKASESHLLGILGHLGASWGHLVATWGHLGGFAFPNPLRYECLGLLGGILGPFLDIFGSNLKPPDLQQALQKLCFCVRFCMLAYVGVCWGTFGLCWDMLS